MNIHINRQTLILDMGLKVGDLGPLDKIEIRGSVKDIEGSGVTGATISIINVFNQQVKVSTRTDSSGRYRIETDRDGQYVLLVTKPEFEANASSLILHSSKPPNRYERNLVVRRLKSP